MTIRWLTRCLLPFLLSALASAQYVSDRYIVELTDSPAIETAAMQKDRRGARLELSRRRTEVQARQRARRSQLEKAGATVIDGVDTVANALFVRASASQAARLSALPGVARVRQAREFQMLLDHAALVHQVDRAWARIGAETAGAGVKIAIIDSGIDADHPGFQDSTLPALDGYPKVNDSSDLAFTNRKVIVARSYAPFFARRDPDASARDHIGHGTALAMAAAGVAHAAPLATISGVAPKAYLGSYKIFGTPGYNDSAPEDAILKAIDDAVADGMDIISLSFGSTYAPRLEDDIEVQAIERAVAAGAIVVVAAGNDGPDPFTIASPATAPSALAVGASHNSRMFSTSAVVGRAVYPSLTGDAAPAVQQITAPVFDVARADGDGLACAPLSASLAGTIALILRGACTFEDKLNNAAAAGAVAALVYTDAARPDAAGMAVGGASLPAQMVSHADGVRIKEQLSAAGDASVEATLRFTLDAITVSANRLAAFSAHGPNVDGSIKPDLLAVGTDFYTATQRSDPAGSMYNANGYISVEGTSFSAPFIAGAAALLKAARPGLDPQQYRSLLVNGAAPLGAVPAAQLHQTGAGLADVRASLALTATASPAGLSFGVAGRSPRLTQSLSLRSVGAGETFQVTVAPRIADAPAPRLSAGMIELSSGGTAELTVQLPGDGLAPGVYDGFVVLQGLTSGSTLRVPYWYAVPASAERISVLDARSMVPAGRTVESAVLFRVFDAAGVPLTDVAPDLTLNGGSVVGVSLREDILPGVFSVDLRMDVRGPSLLHIQIGEATAEVAIRSR